MAQAETHFNTYWRALDAALTAEAEKPATMADVVKSFSFGAPSVPDAVRAIICQRIAPKPTFKPTALIICAIDGDDYFRETTPGYSEGQAYWDVREGQVEDVQQVLLISGATVEDVTMRIAEKIAGNLEDGECVSESAAEFAEEHGGWVRKLSRAEHEANRADYLDACRKEAACSAVEAFGE